MKFTPDEFLSKLPLPADEKWKEGIWFAEAFAKGNFTLEFFAPRGKDYQTPHAQDEFYIVVQGTVDLVFDDKTINCKTGDALFVAARENHRFENISEDFAAWVVFF